MPTITKQYYFRIVLSSSFDAVTTKISFNWYHEPLFDSKQYCFYVKLCDLKKVGRVQLYQNDFQYEYDFSSNFFVQ